MTAMDDIRILRDTRQLLANNGLVHYKFYDSATGCYCTIGALIVACNGGRIPATMSEWTRLQINVPVTVMVPLGNEMARASGRGEYKNLRSVSSLINRWRINRWRIIDNSDEMTLDDVLGAIDATIIRIKTAAN